ncbi:MAG TPA: hypothetical protein DIW40_06460 [Halomonas sp.]|nr:hypothetical protein [Halomonas sp.]
MQFAQLQTAAAETERNTLAKCSGVALSFCSQAVMYAEIRHIIAEIKHLGLMNSHQPVHFFSCYTLFIGSYKTTIVKNDTITSAMNDKNIVAHATHSHTVYGEASTKINA